MAVMKKMVYFVLALVIAAVGIAIGSRGCSERGTVYADTFSDTLTVDDTTRVITPEPRDSVVLRYEYVKLPIAKPIDTVTGIDSVVAELPIEQRHYSDTCYEAWVSGYKPTLDSLHIYTPTTTILHTRTVVDTKRRTRRWGISVGAGATLTPRGVEPGLFVGVTYTFVGW